MLDARAPTGKSSRMAYEFKLARRVEFAETDMAGIVHFSNFFRYMENAEHAFFRSLGASVMMDKLTPPLGFPRVHAECDYRRPIRFEDVLEIQLLVREKRSKVLSYLFIFRKLGDPEPVEIARGILTVVCVAHKEDGSMSAANIPAFLADQIEVAPAELLA
jgi:YbgC/YbaW family acyl-CoA thioester hydrolase